MTRISFIILALFNLTISFGQVGQIAPDFKVTDTHGDTHRLYDYLEKGKTVVLDFFFTTCIPCQYYTPQVNLAFKKYGCNKKDVVFIAIDYNDTNEEVKAYDSKYQIEYPSISGKEGGGNAVVNAYNILGFPTFYVIDSSKKVVMEIDPPTLQVFDFRFNQLGLSPADCELSSVTSDNKAGSFSLLSNLAAGNTLTFINTTNHHNQLFLQICDVMGNPIGTKFPLKGYLTSQAITLPELIPGIYYCTIKDEGGHMVQTSSFLKL